NTSKENCGYHNHSANNRINCNESPHPDIFIQQLDDPQWYECSEEYDNEHDTDNATLKGDRSIEGNQLLLGNQNVYLRARSSSRYNGPGLQISGQNKLMPQRCPPYCADCSRDYLGNPSPPPCQ
ncbi:MAG TPA: hypothetical protein VMW27_07630, partial [Thermoanaerobaculia bacterium]|nr:hypothetical protein [Thermoanaerobaculia bacterium]